MIERFDGWIAGIGTTSGLRAVAGHWPRSPLGPFADVMVERPDGHRTLLAPSEEVAGFVGGTYGFDEVRVGPVHARTDGTTWEIDAGPLRVRFTRGRRSPIGYLLQAVPTPVATDPRWITLTDVVARTLLPGVRTRGSAGGGREEFYGALDLHGLAAASLAWEGKDQGALAPVDPPVRFGFSSAPRTPSLTRVVTLIRTR